MTAAEWIGSIGVALLLLAFALELAGVFRHRPRSYAALNVAGAGLACWASWRIGFLPFVILEGVWALVAVVALCRPQRRSSSADS